MTSTNQIIGTMRELLDAIRARKDALNISYERLDEIANLGERYSMKVLGPKPYRGLSYMNLGAIMGALGMGLQVVDDPRTTAMCSHEWTPRRKTVYPRLALPAPASNYVPDFVPRPRRGRPIIYHEKPWIVQGIPRRTWYRWKARTTA